ncbi:DUF4178 domain-containing protein [Jannaschia seohaensis]|uniref:Uncharacterized protein DUF4178 n=1 Tax=Jannaschia seohaensis TaxID=475081 RepID=A0A2Y9AQR4_9RHOB|nr:DUF4178 domain-containing protein [Jannaschia seohaensis]PWJ18286.1 uncharacterized protein DUF4178 [Jannaschia seohaensis]SSA46811.1 protein of unknown function [Jannaschia seohaensis]
MTGHVSSINCTNCGAGLEVLGGGRVTTQVCGYCGARLDANDAYRVLSVHAAMYRPDTPFKLGMKGLVDGVEHTIIGIAGYVERWQGSEWYWVDHMLYSPTHGYAWLTLEDGHTLLTRKVRDWPRGPFLTSREVERAETRPTREWRGKTYVYYATSSWILDYVEGEFTWRPEKGQRGTAVSLMPKGKASDMLTFADGEEREIEVTRYFPEATAIFGAAPSAPRGVHPLQPYVPKEGKRFYGLWFAAMTVAALVLAMLVAVTSGERITLYEGQPETIPPEMTFDVSRVSRPVRLELFQNLAQTWAEYEMSLTDPVGTRIAETGRGISYYYGGSGEDAWSEGSRYSSLTFQPTVPGTYVLLMEPGEVQPLAGRVPLRLTVQEGRGRALWLLIAAGAFAMAFLWTLSSGWRHRSARWKGSDWTEEDDD